MWKLLYLLLFITLEFKNVFGVATKSMDRRFLELMFLKEFREQFTGEKFFAQKKIDKCETRDKWLTQYHLRKGANLIKDRLSKIGSQHLTEFCDLFTYHPYLNRNIFVEYSNYGTGSQKIEEELKKDTIHQTICRDEKVFLENIHSDYMVEFTQEMLIMKSPLQNGKCNDIMIMFVPGKFGFYLFEYIGNAKVRENTYKEFKGARVVAFIDRKIELIYQANNKWSDSDVLKGLTSTNVVPKTKISNASQSQYEKDNEKTLHDLREMLTSLSSELENVKKCNGEFLNFPF